MSGVIFWTSARVAETLDLPAAVEASFTGIATDTRQLAGGELFVALHGEQFDGHDFLEQARSRGAAAAVVRRGTPPLPGLPVYAVEDPRVALGRLARAWRRALAPGTPVVAITGSTGKTSTKELVRAALAVRYRVHATAGNLNNEVGVPLTLLAAPAEVGALVVEAGASVPGEIARLRDVIEPTIGVVTNVGYSHVAGFGSLEGVLREKLSLLDGVPVAVVGTEPPELAIGARACTRTIVAGASGPADVVAETVTLDAQGHCRIRWHGREATLRLFGLHQAENAMIALAVAREAGVEPAEALGGIADARLPGGRGRVLTVGDLTIIDDTYNANPASLRCAVESAAWLAGQHQRPLVVVVGPMLELGPESARLHAIAAAEIVGYEPALVAVVGDFAGSFAPYQDRLGERLLVAADAEALGPRLKTALHGNEVVLLKASRAVALERVLPHLG